MSDNAARMVCDLVSSLALVGLAVFVCLLTHGVFDKD